MSVIESQSEPMLAIEIGPPGSEDLSPQEAKDVLGKMLKDTEKDGLGVVFSNDSNEVLTGHVLIFDERNWAEAILYVRRQIDDRDPASVSVVCAGAYVGRESLFQHAIWA